MSAQAIARGRMPENAVRVTLPATEVCMHLKIACRQAWAAKINDHAAQIYDEHGHPYSAPVLLCEAGLDQNGQPKPLHEPTGVAVQLPDPPSGLLTIEPVDEQPTIKLTLEQLIDRSSRDRPLAPGDPALPIARLLMRLAAVTATGGLRAAGNLASAAELTQRLSQGGWCCVLDVDGDYLDLVARRRSPALAEAIEELVALRASGTVYLDNREETDTLASAELRVCARSADEKPEP